MDKKELEKTLLDLSERVKLLEQIIELRDRLDKLEKQQFTTPIAPFIPYTVSDCLTRGHDFPTQWFGTTPPSCRRCGAPASWSTPFIVTSSTCAKIPDQG